MPSVYTARFERDMGCTEAELLHWLPGAVGHRPMNVGAGRADIALDGGRLELRWRPLPPRQIALLRMPRLAVGFAFEAVGDDARHAFMRHFDLYTQRGGG